MILLDLLCLYHDVLDLSLRPALDQAIPDHRLHFDPEPDLLHSVELLLLRRSQFTDLAVGAQHSTADLLLSRLESAAQAVGLGAVRGQLPGVRGNLSFHAAAA